MTTPSPNTNTTNTTTNNNNNNNNQNNNNNNNETVTRSTFPPPPPFFKLYDPTYKSDPMIANLPLHTPPNVPTNTYTTFRELHKDAPFTHPLSFMVYTILTTTTIADVESTLEANKDRNPNDELPSNEFLSQMNISQTLRRILRQLMQIYIEVLHLLLESTPESTGSIASTIERKVQLLSGHFLSLTYLLTYLRPHQARVSLGSILQQQYTRTVQKTEHLEALIDRCKEFLTKHHVQLQLMD
jgi:hypothetical protein